MISNENVLIFPVIKNLSVGRNFLVVALNKSPDTGCRNPPAVFSYLIVCCSEDKTLRECGERMRGNQQRKFVPLLSVTARCCSSLSQGLPSCQSAGELGTCTRATVSNRR